MFLEIPVPGDDSEVPVGRRGGEESGRVPASRGGAGIAARALAETEILTSKLLPPLLENLALLFFVSRRSVQTLVAVTRLFVRGAFLPSSDTPLATPSCLLPLGCVKFLGSRGISCSHLPPGFCQLLPPEIIFSLPCLEAPLSL